MKTVFTSEEFFATLNALGNILEVMSKSTNYQNLLNSGKFTPDLNLNDAIQALEETNDQYQLYIRHLAKN